jgi:hypothetical protein
MPRIRKIKTCTSCLTTLDTINKRMLELKGRFLWIRTQNPSGFIKGPTAKHMRELGFDGIITDFHTQIETFTDEQLRSMGLQRIRKDS